MNPDPSPPDLLAEAARRRTFAIISHPDAGKTTLTEKFLLYAGAVQRGRRGARPARGGGRRRRDWMELEQQRGISISSTVLQFPYRDHVVNLLDTPGHRDFSEDTYRVLAARRRRGDGARRGEGHRGPDAQAVPGVPGRAACRCSRSSTSTTGPGREPLELLDEIEKQIGLRPTPVTWPVGIAGDFRGVIDRRTGDVHPLHPHRPRRVARRRRRSCRTDVAAAEEGAAWQTAARRDRRCSTRSAPTSTCPRSSPATRRRCSSARR